MAQIYTPLAQGQAPTFGTSGQAIKDYQTKLNADNAGKAGYVPLKVDGLYGPLTQKASQFGSTPNENLHNVINGNQENDIKNYVDPNAPTTRNNTPSTYTSAYTDLKDTLLKGTDNPTIPNLESQYNNLKSQYHLDNLNVSLNDLTKEEAKIRTSKNNSVSAEMDKPVAMNVISGRVSEQERNFNTRLNSISLQKTAIADQIKTANDAIDTVMKYKTLDYNNAKDNYDKELSQNLAMYNTITGTVNREEDNARANLSIIYNAIQNGGANLDTISPTQKALISSLELKSGLPSGFYQFLQNKNPKADVLTTTTRDDNGTKYSDVLFRDQKTGAVYSKSYNLGPVSKTAGGDVQLGTDLENAKKAIDNGADEGEVKRLFLQTYPSKASAFDDYIYS